METPSASNNHEDTNAAHDYNSTNVKKARLQSTLAALLDDPLLADVPKKPSLSDVDTLISLELGSAMRITVRKLDSTTFDVVVMNTATVKVLKLAIEKYVNEMEQSKMGHRHISWFISYDLWRGNRSRSMYGQIIVLPIIMTSYLMIMPHFRITTSRTTLRCIFYLMLLQRLLESILRGENIVSFMV